MSFLSDEGEIGYVVLDAAGKDRFDWISADIITSSRLDISPSNTNADIFTKQVNHSATFFPIVSS